jgi:hypothetical protein
MLIRYADGSYVDGMIQSLDGGRLWVAAAGLDQDVEFTLVGREWVSASGNPVTFEFPVRVSSELFHIAGSQQDGNCAAGGDCVLRRMCEGNAPPN